MAETFKHDKNQDTFQLMVDRLESVGDEREKRYNDKFEHLEKMYRDGNEQMRREITNGFEQLRRETTTALANSNTATLKQEGAYDKRFEASNEIRKAMSDLMTGFMPRSEAKSSFESLTQEVRNLSKVSDTGMGTKEGSRDARAIVMAVLALLIGAFSGIVSLAAIFMRSK